jgi:hypothetical protein
MTVGKDEHVFALAAHAERLRGMLHHLKKEGGEEVGAAQGAARMSRLHGVYHSYDIPSDLGCDKFQFLNVGH